MKKVNKTTNPTKVLKDIIKLQEQYIKMLGDELDEVVGIAFVHGWRSTRHEQGAEMRAKLQELKAKI